MNRLSLFLAITLLALGSCVPMRKFEDLEAQNTSLQTKYDQLARDYEIKEGKLETFQQQSVEKDRRIQELDKDLALAQQRYRELDETNRDLLERYDRIIAQNQQMLVTASGQKQELTAELSQKENQLRQRELELQRMIADLESRTRRIQELESAIAEKDSRLRELRDKVDAALRGFNAADLTVEERNGRLYVSLSQNLLFPSGSKNINSAGKAAISSLASVLKTNQDINITVEGHTDADGDPSFNWDLSVGRATTVVKELTYNGVSPQRIIAAGRGEFFPVATNSTTQGKSQNRRTEIILTPNLDQLFNLMGGTE